MWLLLILFFWWCFSLNFRGEISFEAPCEFTIFNQCQKFVHAKSEIIGPWALSGMRPVCSCTEFTLSTSTFPGKCASLCILELTEMMRIHGDPVLGRNAYPRGRSQPVFWITEAESISKSCSSWYCLIAIATQLSGLSSLFFLFLWRTAINMPLIETAPPSYWIWLNFVLFLPEIWNHC